MTNEPFTVPLSPSPPGLASQSGNSDSPPTFRPRSDTVLTTSSASSSSSPHLQTPQTPSIMGVLDPRIRHRADSYGFSDFGKVLFQDEAVETRFADPEPIHGLEEEEAVEDTLQVEDPLSPLQPTATHQTPDPEPTELVSQPGAFSTNGPPEQALLPLEPPGTLGEDSSAPVKGKTKATAVVRAKLQRSKSSLKEVFRIKNSSAGPSIQTTGNLIDEMDLGEEKRRPRLRSLLSFSGSRGSRASSTTSMRTTHTLNSGMLAEPPAPSTLSSETPVTPASFARDFAVSVPRHEGAEDMPPRATLMGGASEDDHIEPLTIKPTRTQRRVRPLPASAVSPSKVSLYTRPPPPMTRSATAPVLAEGTLSRPRSTGWEEQPKRDLFAAMLPRELKVMILRTVLDMSKDTERQGRWDGVVGARRELIRLSRVSKAWQALCFDGQLWPIVDLAHFVSVLHPRTIDRILHHAGPFIRSLSLHGMDAYKGSELVKALVDAAGHDQTHESALCNLTTLDLRGCKKLDSGSIISLIHAAPNLRAINFKGVQAVSSEVIRCLARSACMLESLDVSRCWDISLCDLCVFVKMLSPDQAARVKVLRAGGMKAYGTTAADFLPLALDRLINLEVLDLLGCTHIFDNDIIRAVETLEAQSRHSRLRHLNLSGCVCLTSAIFPSMRGIFPDLERLELASIPEMFDENGDGDKAFHNFIMSLSKLERLDLDSTGSSAGVNDKMLQLFTPPKGEKNNLIELRIGYAKGVTPEGMIRFIRGCTTLRFFEADNTSATNAVMREFYRRHARDASISLVDCRAITPISYSHLSSSTRPRDGFGGYEAIPMAYDDSELDDRVVIKVFWSWRRVGVPKGWRDTLKAREREIAQSRAGSAPNSGVAGTSTPTGRGGRGKGWWRNDETFDDRTGCVVQ